MSQPSFVEEPIRALEGRYYTDPAVFEREKAAVFYRTWQYAGHVSELEAAGDYFTFSVCDQALFTVRGEDGCLRTFHNVCMHRGHRLVEGTGRKRALVCPYHGWTYELAGGLRGARNAQRTRGFDRSQVRLAEVRTEVLHGFVFVNLDREARPLGEWFPGVSEELLEYLPNIGRLRPIASVPVEERCNWKVTVENYNECYHCRVNHPTFVKGVVDPASYNVVPRGRLLRHSTRAADASAMSYAFEEGAGGRARDYGAWYLWPAFSFQVYPGGVLNTYLWRPLEVGRTMVYRGWYTVEGAPSETVAKLARQDRETTVAEDLRLVESVQQGLHSRGYRPGPLVLDPDLGVDSEHSVRALKEWVLEALSAHDS